MTLSAGWGQRKKKSMIGRFRTIGLIVASVILLGGSVPARAAGLMPFKGSAVTTDQVVGVNPNDANVLFAIVSGTGNATYLGQFSLFENTALDLRSFTFFGFITWTTARGDKLFGRTVGALTPGGTSGITTFTGGTGRFQNVTGAIHFNGVNQGTPDAPLFFVNYGGAISFNR